MTATPKLDNPLEGGSSPRPCSVSYLEGALAKAKMWSINNSSYSHHTEEHRDWLRGYADYPDKFTAPNATVIEMKRQREAIIDVTAELEMCYGMPPTDPSDWDFDPETPHTDRLKILEWARASHSQCSSLARKLKDIVDPLPGVAELAHDLFHGPNAGSDATGAIEKP